MIHFGHGCRIFRVWFFDRLVIHFERKQSRFIIEVEWNVRRYKGVGAHDFEVKT